MCQRIAFVDNHWNNINASREVSSGDMINDMIILWVHGRVAIQKTHTHVFSIHLFKVTGTIILHIIIITLLLVKKSNFRIHFYGFFAFLKR